MTDTDAVRCPEKWRVVQSHPRYEVSDAGRVRIASSGRLLGQQSCGSGRYLKVTLSESGKRDHVTVHTLVAYAFLGARPDKHVCDHINRNGLDNRASNLAWITKQKNAIMLDKLSAEQREEIAASAGRVKQSELAERFGVHIATVQRIQRADRKAVSPAVAASIPSARN